MTFNYFNPGRTAWGKKISGVFNTLDLMAQSAEERINEITGDTDYYLQFTNRNYRAPEPTRPDLPARVIDALEVIEGTVKIVDISYSSGTLHVVVLYTAEETGRPVTAFGTTTLSSGYIHIAPPNGSEQLEGKLVFSDGGTDTDAYKEAALFKFEIIDSKVYLSNYSAMNIQLGEHEQYKSLTITQVGTSNYTCEKNSECVIACAGYNGNSIYLNDTAIYLFQSLQNQRIWTPLYLKKGDKVRIDGYGVERNIYRVNYNT